MCAGHQGALCVAVTVGRIDCSHLTCHPGAVMNGWWKVVMEEQERDQDGVKQQTHSKMEAAEVRLHSHDTAALRLRDSGERASSFQVLPSVNQGGFKRCSALAAGGALTPWWDIFRDDAAPQTPLSPSHVSLHKWDVQAEGCGLWTGCVEGGAWDESCRAIQK